MKNNDKVGYVLRDKDIKFVNRLLKKEDFIVEGELRIKDDILIKITNVRKYQSRWNRDKFCYEVDVEVSISPNFKGSHYWYRSTDNRRIYRYVRWNNSKILSELSYFGISNIVISKINIKF